MSSGLINGYSIAAVAAQAANAEALANSAWNKANSAEGTANSALSKVSNHKHTYSKANYGDFTVNTGITVPEGGGYVPFTVASRVFVTAFEQGTTGGGF